ncbi:N-acetylglucosamine kinase [Caldisalinibacter kiritimatiensis]|uniref:N-acetylglucosamine kinase of eukaryotic type n=1 Tax=Caldisalinibacter kiritimatiensis TaxID=1304284 RepID=R1ATV1_9FIRM|nr:BadF/BadG/BcrA/BcrD ATPase family protein [Caldisalinibacter kiritimatiensis]EOD00087.1 N-acetylglucosamine kinase of eukaryotic type [Caldisalinibacter kiritimatiensis]
MKYIIGIDGGGTKTLGYISNIEGKIIGKATSGVANYHSVGLKKVRESLLQLINTLCDINNIKTDDIALLSLGLAGVDRKEDRQLILDLISSLELDCKVALNNDAKTALVGAHGKEEGIITISGTGSISYGIDSEGNTIRAGGWGHILDDEGSGYDIGLKGIKAVVRYYDNRGKKTILIDKVLKFLNMKSPDELISYVYGKNTTKSDIAKIAPIVCECALEGDEISQIILDQAVNSLVEMTSAVIDKSNFKDERITVSYNGGILNNASYVQKEFIKRLKYQYKNIEVYKPKFDPAIGALIIGFRQLNINYDINKIKKEVDSFG